MAAALVLGCGVLLVGPGDDRAVEPAPAVVEVPDHPTVDVGAAFTAGGTVFLDGGTVRVPVPGLGSGGPLLTSAGAVVLARDTARLVTPDGSARELDTGGNLASDTTQPLVAWTEESGGAVTAVVLDVVTGERLAEVAVTGHGGGFAPVALDGEHVYVGHGAGEVLDVHWTTGEVSVADGLTFVDEIAGGRSNLGYGGVVRVVDVATGTTLVRRETTQDSASYFRLSPDGRFALLTDQGAVDSPPMEVVDLDADTSVTVPGGYYGWTADGDLVAVDDDAVLRVCSPRTGECSRDPLDIALDAADPPVPAGTGSSS